MEVNKQKFTYRMHLVELTKHLERDTVDTLTFTYKLGHNYAANSLPISFSESTYGESPVSFDGWWDKSQADNFYRSPTAFNIPFDIKNIQLYFDNMKDVLLETKIYLTIPGEGEQYLGIATGDTGTKFTDYILPNTGTYYLDYRHKQDLYSTYQIRYEFTAVAVTLPKRVPSITDCIQRLLDVTPTRLISESKKYILDPVFAAKYANVPAPEFYLTRNTLREALGIIGGYIHAIPRLIWNKVTDKPNIITFDELGGSDEYTLPAYAKMIGFNRGINPNEYCGAIESYVDNLINTQDQAQGSIEEPFSGGKMTPRSETIQISNDTAVIQLSRPIYTIQKLECFNVDNSAVVVGDITPFLYEQSEYDTLASYGGNYPYAKKYALVYKQGDKKISGLNTVEAVAISFENLLKEPSMTNIINAVLGRTTGSYDYANLAFRVTYTPIVSTRVKQLYPYKGRPKGNTVFYNQGANTVESSYYGENLKGGIARIGQYVNEYTYRFVSVNDLPKIGQKYKGEYICRVEKEYDMQSIKCTFTTTPNFNKLSQYLALNSNFRLFEVSERQSVERDINYSEICYVGDFDDDSTTSGLQASGIAKWKKVFTQDDSGKPITVATAQPITEDYAFIGSETAHSTISLAIGNSLAFEWEYQDNYSAGDEATYYSDKIKVRKKVPYVDAYGEMYGLNFVLGSGLYQTQGGFYDQVTTSGTQGDCDQLPRVRFGGGIIEPYFIRNALCVRKDSREHLKIITQIHFVANRESIVIGTRLCQNNPLVTKTFSNRRAHFVLLPNELNSLNDIVDLSTTTFIKQVEDSDFYISGRKISFGGYTNQTGNSYKSWALVDPSTSRLYIGENQYLMPYSVTSTITFNF